MSIECKQILMIINILRAIGLNTTHKGTKYLCKAIQIMFIMHNDMMMVEDIYEEIAKFYGNITSKQVKDAIFYTINNRDKEKAKRNFEKILGFEYDEYVFTNKRIIEEITRVIIQE